MRGIFNFFLPSLRMVGIQMSVLKMPLYLPLERRILLFLLKWLTWCSMSADQRGHPARNVSFAHPGSLGRCLLSVMHLLIAVLAVGLAGDSLGEGLGRAARDTEERERIPQGSLLVVGCTDYGGARTEPASSPVTRRSQPTGLRPRARPGTRRRSRTSCSASVPRADVGPARAGRRSCGGAPTR